MTATGIFMASLTDKATGLFLCQNAQSTQSKNFSRYLGTWTLEARRREESPETVYVFWTFEAYFAGGDVEVKW